MRTEAKLLAILDRCTCIPLIATRYHPATAREAAMFRRHGFKSDPGDDYTFFYLPNEDLCSYDPYRMGHDYTVGTACRYVREHWDEIESGAAIDSEFIRGETKAPKTGDEEYDWVLTGPGKEG